MTTDNLNPEQIEQASAPQAEPAQPPPVPAPHVPEDVAQPLAELKSETEVEVDAEAEETEEPESEPEADAATEAAVPVAPPSNLEWYVVKVQSGREETIKAAIERKVKIEGLQDCYDQIVIPTEKVSEMRKNKRYIRERKLLPGYFFAHVEFNDRILYLFRETSGVGDFVGASIHKKPLPMGEIEIRKWLGKQEEGDTPVSADVKGKSPFNEGDRVKVKDGMFSGMEGVVKQLLEAKGAIVVELTIFGRPVPVELEYWQVDFE